MVSIQDLGAAGITCATCETADRGGTGMLVDLDAIPRREPGMAPFEVMISESQERMVAIVEPAQWEAVRGVCERWELPVAIIGRVTTDGDIVILTAPDGGGALDAGGHPVAGATELARMPARALASEAIVFNRLSTPPAKRRNAPAPGAPADSTDHLPMRGQDPGAVLLALLGSPNLSSRRQVYEQYDHNVQANTVAGPGRGAAVLRIKGTTKGLVATTDGNASVSAIDPWLGAAFSVAEAARNVSITGARPLGVTNCLNYGDPTRPEAFWALAEGVRGLADACVALGLPVTGGNVSLYNEAPGSAIAPTPEIGIVGLFDDIAIRRGPAFTANGNSVMLVGEPGPGLAGSEYARLAGGVAVDGPPSIDLVREAHLQTFIREAIARGLVEACQDVSGGGFAVAVAEMAMWGDCGATLRLGVGDSPAIALFGESPSRLVVEVAPRHVPALELLARHNGLPVHALGTTGGDTLRIELAGEGATGAAEERGSRIADALEVPVADMRHAWEHGLPRALGWEAADDIGDARADGAAASGAALPGLEVSG